MLLEEGKRVIPGQFRGLHPVRVRTVILKKPVACSGISIILDFPAGGSQTLLKFLHL
jgi:hypothetical protein